MATAKDKSHKSSKKESSKTKKEPKSRKDKDKKEEEKSKHREGRESRKDASKAHEAAATPKKRKAEEVPEKKRKKRDKTEKPSKEKSKVKDAEDSAEADRRRVQGGAADAVVNGSVQKQKEAKDKSEKRSQKHEKDNEKHESKSSKKPESKSSKSKRERHGPCAAEALDLEVHGGSTGSRAIPSKSRSPEKIQLKSSPEAEKVAKAPEASNSKAPPAPQQSSDHSDSETSGERRRKRRENAGLKAATGFGLAPPPPAPGDFLASAAMYGPAGPLVPLPEKVKGLLEHQDSLAQEVMRMKMAVEAASGTPAPGMKLESKEDPAETTLKMPTRLTDCLMEPDNLAKLLAKTGLLSATLNQEKHLLLRAASRKQLQKTLGQLRRIAWACQWGCSSVKVAALLAEKPAKAVNSMVLRLAATSSRLSSHDARLNAKMRKIRLGTQAGPGMLVLEGIPGLSRKHCTITFEPEKGACYVQDLSTNGTYLNGKRLPRPPFKNQSDARVRLFHGDELLFKLRTDDAEEFGYVINLLELS